MIPFTADSGENGNGHRYRTPSYASHVIGYTNSDGTGASGIEKALEDEINGGGAADYYLLDAAGNAIPNFKTSTLYDKDGKFVKLTLDYHIQKITENVLDASGIIGAAVVLDVESFDVLAMASRPDFSRDSVSRYISSGGTELLNRATSPYNAGSIFKIITAAAAMEEEIADTNFTMQCKGTMKIDGIDFVCHKKEGHGLLTFEQAFSKSCNCAFYEMGISLGSAKICEYAKKFGIGENVLSACLSENGGNIPEYLSYTGSESANLSIGQGEIMITPLQAAKTVCVIASGGMSKQVNIVDSVIFADGEKIKDYRKISGQRVISRETAAKIADMMMKTTTEGTGSNALSEKVQIAGKTGSAETGWQTDDGYMVQGWFVGFFPFDEPKYALAVMTENGRQGNISCAPVFKEIAEKITEIKK